ncbi:MAG: amino acid carrier protein [Acidobacteria bacterium]|jgi:AGCS family alanine or glycine:cation symporter|nr:amino acid carrier protein [Acidobacteriota bacterium]
MVYDAAILSDELVMTSSASPLEPLVSALGAVGEAASTLVFRASDAAFGPWTVILLFGIGLFLSLRLRFVQIRHLRGALASLKPRAEDGAGALSPFQAFMTALAASVGTGNIAGVATAIVSGGPGALLWLWCYGFFATAVKFTEAVLGVQYRSLGSRYLSAGPMHYLRDGLGLKRLGWLYALIAGVAALTTTPITQPNSIAIGFESHFHVPTIVTGVGVAVVAWLVIIGGIKSIGRTAEKLAPMMVALYLLGGLLVIATHTDRLADVFLLVLREAFSLKAGLGSAAGVGIMMAMRYGLARGIYANEAGYGTAAVAYGTARSRRPVQQGYAAVMEVFVVSFVTSTISALTILVTGVWRSGLTSTAAVAEAFNHAIPLVGGWVVAVCAFLFGYTTLLGWAYYGEQFFAYTLGPRVVVPYRWVYCGLIVIGATSHVNLVWAWGDLMNGLQILPNLVGLVGLSGVAAALLKREETRSGEVGEP